MVARVDADGSDRSVAKTSDSRVPVSSPVPVLNGVALEIGRGEVVGIIGVNGSGKSTLIQILASASSWPSVRRRFGEGAPPVAGDQALVVPRSPSGRIVRGWPGSTGRWEFSPSPSNGRS